PSSRTRGSVTKRIAIIICRHSLSSGGAAVSAPAPAGIRLFLLFDAAFRHRCVKARQRPGHRPWLPGTGVRGNTHALNGSSATLLEIAPLTSKRVHRNRSNSPRPVVLPGRGDTCHHG